MRLDLLDPELQIAPGDTATCRVRIHNDSTGPASYRLRVVGLREDNLELADLHHLVPVGGVLDVDVDMRVPLAFAAGKHSVAVEVQSDRRGERAAVAGLTVEVGSIRQVAINVAPSTIRARRRGSFKLGIDNFEERPVDLHLAGEGPHLQVRFRQADISVRPGASTTVKGRVKGPRLLVGDPIQHVVTFTATGRSAPVYAQAGFAQRPLLPRRLRSFVAILIVVALWIGLLVVGTLAWNHRDDGTLVNLAHQPWVIDTNLDGVPDQVATPAAMAPGGVAAVVDAATAEVAAADAAAAAAAEDAANAALAPTETKISGTVKTAKAADASGVTVSMVPITLGEPPADATAAPPTGRANPGKIWSSRYGRDVRCDPLGLGQARSTESLQTFQTGADGLWSFGNVCIPDTYELNFAKLGYDTKSFVVTPPADGTSVELPVELVTATGSVGGTVSGPNGALGGVSLSLTDGTLVFQTTTSTEAGKVGEWSIDRVGTPATYTLTATLRGFGTEVLQVPLLAGQPRSGINISMKSGVGTIAGTITSGAELFGGVELTATSGDLTRTTSSLTIGAEGTYSFPQLTIPGLYTVTASAGGYVTQTREVQLDGNVTGIDFQLARTTATLVGSVVSSTGAALAGTQVKITRDKVAFATTTGDGAVAATTAVAPAKGSFRVEDLSPGDYVVSFTRFDHAEVSQLVSLAAGETRDLGTITMAFQSRSALAQTGRVVIPMLDADGQALTGVTLQLLSSTTGAVAREISDTENRQATFAFDNVPIGTYVLRAVHPKFRTQTKRISVGLGEITAEFRMVPKGAVSGRVVDAFSLSSQLKDYEVKIYRLSVTGVREGDFLERIVVNSDARPNQDGDIVWESSANSLNDGLYEVEVSNSPPGYLVRPDQLLDADLPGTTMRFSIGTTDQGTIRVNDLQADPFPVVQGRLLLPLKGSGTNPLDFKPLDKDATVTMLCPGVPAPVPGQLLNNSTTFPGPDAFLFPALTIDDNNLLGNCSITVASAGLTTTVVPTPAPVAVSDGIARSDQFINIAITSPVPINGGSVFFTDPGLPASSGGNIPVPGAIISADSPVVTGFLPGSGSTAAQPQFIRTTLAPATSGATGDWVLAGQLFDNTRYVFTAAGFTTGSLEVEIDQNGRRLLNPTGLSATTLGDAIVVHLRPIARTISGTIRIFTTGTRNFAGVGIATTSPSSTTGADGAPTVDPTTGKFSVNPAEIGTWKVAFTPPTGHIFAPGSAAALSGQLLPSGTEPEFDASFIELGKITVVVRDARGPISTGTAPSLVTPLVTFSRSATAVPGDPGVLAPADLPVDASGQRVYSLLSVNTSNPANVAAAYHLSTNFPGYDETRAAVAITGSITRTLTGSTDIPVPVRAGDSITVTITLPGFGGLKGSVTGLLDTTATPATTPLRCTDVVGAKTLCGPNGLTVIAKRVRLANGTPISDSPVEVSVDPGNPNGFIFTGPPGSYTIVPSDAAYQTMSGPDQAREYLLSNEVTTAVPGLTLQVIGGSVVTELGSTGNDADVVISRSSGAGPVQVAAGTTDIAGHLSIPGLDPGTYTVTIRHFDRSGGIAPFPQDRFPIIVTLSIPVSRVPAARTITVTTTMLRVGGSVSGTIEAKNGDNESMPLPGDVQIDRVYSAPTVPSIVVGGVNQTNGAGESQQSAGFVPLTQIIKTRDGSVAETPLSFSFDNLAAGGHTLTFSAETGYTINITNPLPVISNGIDGNVIPTVASGSPQPSIIYGVNNVPVTINVVSDNATPGDISDDTPLTTSTVVLTPTTGTLTPLQLGPVRGGMPGGVYTFASVMPKLSAYRLTVIDPQFLPYPATDFTVQMAPASNTLTVRLVPAKSLISGTARQADSAGPEAPLSAAGALVTLYQLQSPSDMVGVLFGTAVTPDSLTGKYEFLVNETGEYRVEATVPTGYAPSRFTKVTVNALGKAAPAADIAVKKHAIITVPVTGPSTAVGAQVIMTITPGGSTNTCSASLSCVFGALDPDKSYSFAVSAPKFHSMTVAPAVSTDPAPGANLSVPVTLLPRTVTVAVTANSAGDASSATVKIGVPTINDAIAAGSLVTATNASGSSVYTATLVPAGTGEIEVSRNGYRTAVVAFSEPEIDIPSTPVTIFKEATVEGVLKSGLSAYTATAVTVTATKGGQTRTDSSSTADGTYSITGLSNGTWTLTAEKLGVGSISTNGAKTVVVTASSSSPISLDLPLIPRAVRLVFTVLDGASNPVPGATITIDGVAKSPLTDANGKAIITGLDETEPLMYTISKTGYLTTASTQAVITNASVAIPLTDTVVAGIPALVATPNVTGTLFRADGTTAHAVAGIVITATKSSGGTVTGTTNGSGVYTLSGLSSGNWTLSGSALGFGAAAGSSFQLSNAGTYAVPQNLTMVPRPVTVTFTVKNGTTPISGVAVTIGGKPVTPAALVTDGSGVLTVSGLFENAFTGPGLTLDYTASKAGFSTVSNPVTLTSASVLTSSSVTAVAVPMTAIPDITGTLFRQGGTAHTVAGVTITATRTGGGGASPVTTTTGSGGTYTLSGLTPGEWTLSAPAQLGFGVPGGTPFTLTANADYAAARNLTMVPRAITLRFTVTSGGTGLVGAKVTVNGTASADTSASGQVDVTGLFENSNLSYTAAKAGFFTSTSQTVNLASLDVAGGVTMVPDIALVAIPAITGTVTVSGAAVAGAAVSLCAAGTATASACASGNFGTDTSSAGSGFSITPTSPTTFSYVLFASKNGQDSAAYTVTISAVGVVSIAPSSAIVVPP